MRRKTDLNYFRLTYLDTVKTVRVKSDDQVRKNRNWIFQPGKSQSQLMLFNKQKKIIII